MPAAYSDWSRLKTKRNRWNLKIGEVSEYDPKITQDAPNIVPRYWCSTLRPVPAGPDQHDDQWRFCPRCGSLSNTRKAEPVQWRSKTAKGVAAPLIQLVQDRGLSSGRIMSM